VSVYDYHTSTTLRFLGVAGYEIVGPTSRVLIDPFLSHPAAACSPDELERPDVILVTHAAYDHYGDAAAIASRTGAPVVCGADVRLLLLHAGVPDERIRVTTWGIVVGVGGVTVRPLECHHWSQAMLGETRITGVPMAYIIEPEPGIRVYHYGDTAIFDMRLFGELYRPTVGIFGCTNPVELDDPGAGELLTGEMDPDEAAYAAEMLGVQIAFASHYFSRTPDCLEFVKRVAARDTTGHRIALVPEVGESVVLEVRSSGTVALAQGERRATDDLFYA
jgi:L-ascorbate metabolism protein UlaG (beta-lactamase superfamily)